MNESDQEPPPHRRKLLWAAFWFVFLSTPVCAGVAVVFATKLHFSSLNSSLAAGFWAVTTTAAAGAALAGFILARIMSESNEGYFSRGMRWGFVVFALYFSLTFLINGIMRHL